MNFRWVRKAWTPFHLTIHGLASVVELLPLPNVVKIVIKKLNRIIITASEAVRGGTLPTELPTWIPDERLGLSGEYLNSWARNITQSLLLSFHIGQGGVNWSRGYIQSSTDIEGPYQDLVDTPYFGGDETFPVDVRDPIALWITPGSTCPFGYHYIRVAVTDGITVNDPRFYSNPLRAKVLNLVGGETS